MNSKAKALYAIPCAFGSIEDIDEDSIFFLTFATQNEHEAYKLAECVCGPKSRKALVIINEHGEIFKL